MSQTRIRGLSLGLKMPMRNQVKFGLKKVTEGKKKGKTNGFGSRNELRRLRAGWAGIGSSRQAEAIDGVQLAPMSQQITDLSRAFAQSVAQNKVMSKTVEELKKQVVSMSPVVTVLHLPIQVAKKKQKVMSLLTLLLSVTWIWF
ncbi:hypothetical protein P3S68_003831 [Capsicum galapagoense]